MVDPNCLDYLDGKWVRVESNNSSNDCLQVVLSNDQAIVLANPRRISWIETGEALWRKIEHQQGSETQFNLGALGAGKLI